MGHVSSATAGATRARRQRMSRADREQQMLDVAERMFAEGGFQAVSMEDIAEQVGVTKPMLYEYFGSKGGLLLAAIARCRDELYEVTKAAMALATDPKDVLWRGLLAYFQFTDAHRQAYAMLAHGPMALSPVTVEALEATRRQQVDLIAPLLSAFAPHASAATAEAYAEILIGACERLGLWRLRHPEVTAEDAARHMMNFSWYGLGRAVAGHDQP
jgi:AcrR family transcriptional regulator